MSFPMVVTFPCPSFGSGLNDSLVVASTLAMIPLACGSITCAPSLKYTLKPLSYGGLWLAVMTAPALACRCRTANESSGTERGLSNTNASQPFSAATFAASAANSFEKNRGSCAITILGFVEICSRRFQSCK